MTRNYSLFRVNVHESLLDKSTGKVTQVYGSKLATSDYLKRHPHGVFSPIVKHFALFQGMPDYGLFSHFFHAMKFLFPATFLALLCFLLYEYGFRIRKGQVVDVLVAASILSSIFSLLSVPIVWRLTEFPPNKRLYQDIAEDYKELQRMGMGYKRDGTK